MSLLSMLLIFGSTAKEFVHLFAHHEDTVHHIDHICPPGEAHFDHEHHHCSFLHFLLEPFANDAFVPRLQLSTTNNFAIKHAVVCAKFIPRNIDQIQSRGPPSIRA